jgi:hypothetical protein
MKAQNIYINPVFFEGYKKLRENAGIEYLRIDMNDLSGIRSPFDCIFSSLAVRLTTRHWPGFRVMRMNFTSQISCS